MAHRPWLIAQEPVLQIRTPEPLENVERCMNCEKEDCTNCMGPNGCRTARGRPPLHLFDREFARLLWSQGMTDSAIARACNVPKSSVSSWRRKQGLEPCKKFWGRINIMPREGGTG